MSMQPQPWPLSLPERFIPAVALNLIQLGAWWNGRPLDRNCPRYLAELDLFLAA
jgi:hypothetical protein